MLVALVASFQLFNTEEDSDVGFFFVFTFSLEMCLVFKRTLLQSAEIKTFHNFKSFENFKSGSQLLNDGETIYREENLVEAMNGPHQDKNNFVPDLSVLTARYIRPKRAGVCLRIDSCIAPSPKNSYPAPCTSLQMLAVKLTLKKFRLKKFSNVMKGERG